MLRVDHVRVLRERGGVRERRRQARHPPGVRTEYGPPPRRCGLGHLQLSGPHRVYYDLYVMIDISQCVVGWQVAPGVSLLAELNIDRNHSRRGFQRQRTQVSSTLKHCPAFGQVRLDRRRPRVL